MKNPRVIQSFLFRMLVVLWFCFMVSCTSGTKKIKESDSEIPVYLDDTKSIDLRVSDALSRMTLEEKIRLSTAQSRFSSPGVKRLGIPELWMSDGPHGVRFEIEWDSWNSSGFGNDSCTAFPALTCLAATWNTELSHKFGKAIGEEARYRKKEVLLGPGVNIYRTPMNGRNFEYMGEDPYLSSRMVVPYIQGVQENGVASCVKHFALNNQEKFRNEINVELSDRAFNEIYLPAFKAAVTEGKCWAIMGSYNKIRGQHACHNDMLLNQILKKDWAFDGCVITDWGGAHDTKEAIFNGTDIEMGTHAEGQPNPAKNAFNDYFLGKDYLKMAKAGEVPMSIVDDKASRILKLIFRTAMNTKRPWGSFATSEHSEVAREIGEEGIVLLKNEGNLLPVTPEKYKRIAVIGENGVKKLTVGGGSSELKVKKEVSPLEGITAVYGEDKIKYSKGYTSDLTEQKLKVESLFKEAIGLAANSDVVIFIGGLNKDPNQDSEGDDRLSYDLPFGQNELISAILKVNKNLVVVLHSGNAVAMPWVNEVPSIVQGWFLGSEAGNALANVLSGKVNPSGKLPFSYPKKLDDNGAISFGPSSYPGDGINEYYKEDILVGYRWFDTKNIEPLFPFGHGLSYTSFEYGEATIDNKSIGASDKIAISIPVKNIGANTGSEVVQLYIKDEECSVLRPEKELKAFAKVKLGPGETKVVDFQIDSKSLSFFDEVKKAWKVEPGKFKAFLASSSKDIRKSVEFEVK
jgi:beta-glucosidase